MNSPLQLEAYAIESVSVSTNRRYDPGKRVHGRLELSPRLVIGERRGEDYQVALRVKYLRDPDEPTAIPYEVRIQGRAFYRLEPVQDRNEGLRLLLFNGPAILYGLLRAHIAQTTALGLHGPMLLPTANLVDALEDWFAEIEQKQKRPEKPRAKPVRTSD